MKQEFEKQTAAKEQVSVELTATEEAHMEALLAPLRALKPLPELRMTNRRRMLEALHDYDQEMSRGKVAWWRRTINIPVPLAAAAMALIAFLGGYPLLLQPHGPSMMNSAGGDAAYQAPQTPGLASGGELTATGAAGMAIATDKTTSATREKKEP